MKTLWVTYFVALGLCGCAANSEQNKSAPTPSITADCANADSEVASACTRLVADAQGEANQHPATMLIDKSMFTAATPEAVKHSSPPGFAEALLRDESI